MIVPASIEKWSTRTSEIGGLPFLEMREGQTIFRYIPPGSQVDVSINGGSEWRHSRTPARSMFEAEGIGRGVASLWREQNARKRSRKPYRQSVAAAVGQARGRARFARAAREAGGGHGKSLRDWRDPPPPGFEFDLPEAVALARAELSTYRASLEGSGGWKELFGAAVAVVRGYGLLPDSMGWIVLSEYNESAEPPWSAAELRRALARAEDVGQMPWGVLLFRDLSSRGGVRGGGNGEP